MNHREYTVEFRIFNLNPASITRDLGLKPCMTWIEGTARFPEYPDRIDPNMWAYNGSDKQYLPWNSLEEGLRHVLDRIWPPRAVIASYPEMGGKLIWWCGHFYATFDGGPTLSAALLRDLGELGAELFIDNHYGGDDGVVTK